VLVVKKPLSALFNLSVLSVVPLFESGDKRNISNYRRISILSAIPKLFKKLVGDVITRPSISD
jgi:hypothetical protein